MEKDATQQAKYPKIANQPALITQVPVAKVYSKCLNFEVSAVRFHAATHIRLCATDGVVGDTAADRTTRESVVWYQAMLVRFPMPIDLSK